MLYFACPQCRAVLSAPPEKAEKLFQCPKCGRIVRPPQAPDVAETQSHYTTDAPPVRQETYLPGVSSEESYLPAASEPSSEPDLIPDWAAETKQTNVHTFMIAAMVVGALAMVVVVILIVNSAPGGTKIKPKPVAKVTPMGEGNNVRFTPPHYGLKM